MQNKAEPVATCIWMNKIGEKVGVEKCIKWVKGRIKDCVHGNTYLLEEGNKVKAVHNSDLEKANKENASTKKVNQ